MNEENSNKLTGPSIIEYILVILLVAVVVAVALITLGESKEDYQTRPDETTEIEESE